MNKKMLVILIALVGLLFQPVFVYTEQSRSVAENVGGNTAEIEQLNKAIAEKKDKIKQLEQTIEEYKKQINQKRLESVSLKNQMAIINNRVLQVELDIQVTQEKLDSLQLEIETLQLSIEDKEKVMNKQKLILAELIQDIHYNDNKNYLEIAASYDNFSDFYKEFIAFKLNRHYRNSFTLLSRKNRFLWKFLRKAKSILLGKKYVFTNINEAYRKNN